MKRRGFFTVAAAGTAAALVPTAVLKGVGTISNGCVNDTEITLLKGTVEMAYEKTNKVVRLMIGDDSWKPSEAELRSIADTFMKADALPGGNVFSLSENDPALRREHQVLADGFLNWVKIEAPVNFAKCDCETLSDLRLQEMLSRQYGTLTLVNAYTEKGLNNPNRDKLIAQANYQVLSLS